MIKPVRSEVALSPCNNEVDNEVLENAIQLSLSDAKLEPASNWQPIIVHTVPKCILTLADDKEVAKEMLSDKLERVTSVRPVFLGRNIPEAPHRT